MIAKLEADVVTMDQTPDITEGQEIIAKHHFRPRHEAILKKYAKQFPPIATFSVDGALGGWDKVQNDHFSDGAIYDQIVIKR